MNRAIALVLAVLVMAMASLVIVPALGRRPGLPPAAQAELDAYLGGRYSGTQPPPLHRAIRATQPWEFDASASSATWSDSPYYRTTHNRRRSPVADTLSPEGSPTSESGRQWAAGERPLPYPPSELWCVSLSREDQTEPSIVYLARHQDLYNADWILHEARGDARQVAEDLARVGCNLGAPASNAVGVAEATAEVWDDCGCANHN